MEILTNFARAPSAWTAMQPWRNGSAWKTCLLGFCPYGFGAGTIGLTWKAIDLIGMEGLMLSMYDNPDGLHRLMAFLRDDELAFSNWLEEQELYSLNNENDYIGSGSMGYTAELPQDATRQAGSPVREKDLWVLMESQETVGVGPELFEEFVFPYQLSIGERFGKTYYGCCEPLNNRWDIVKRIPNLARVAVSPCRL
jgi:hypothetical protein